MKTKFSFLKHTSVKKWWQYERLCFWSGEHIREIKISKENTKTRNFWHAWAKVFSGFRREVAMNCSPLGYYSAISGNSLRTFRENLLVPSSGCKGMGPIGCSETSVRNYHYSLQDNPDGRSSHTWTILHSGMVVCSACVSNQYSTSCHTACSLCADNSWEPFWIFSLKKLTVLGILPC